MELRSCYDLAFPSTTTLLHHAAATGNESMATTLLNKGCHIDEQDNSGKTALMLAVECAHANTVAALLRFRPNIYATDKFNRSVLQRVFRLNLTSRAIIKMFLIRLKNECVGGTQQLAMKLMSVRCPMYWAILLRDTEVTKILMDNGWSVNAEDHCTITALHVALISRDFANAKLLIECGANVDALDSYGRVPLACLRQYNDSNEELEIVQMLLDRSTTLDSADSYGFLQYHELLLFGRSKAVISSLKSNIDWSGRDLYGSTPLHYLARNYILDDNLHILDHVKEIKINIRHLHRSVHSLFTLAANRNLPKLVEILLDRGVNPNTRCNKGNTPLMTVFSIANDQYNAEKVISLLLQYGADIQLNNHYGRTVFDHILNTPNIRLRNLLVGNLAFIAFLGTQIIMPIKDIINSNDVLKNEFEACIVQLGNLQKTTIGNAIGVFELFNASEKRLALLARDQDFFHHLTCFNDFTLNPYYADKFERRIEKTLQYIKLRKEYSDLICELMGIPHDSYTAIVDAIIDYVLA